MTSIFVSKPSFLIWCLQVPFAVAIFSKDKTPLIQRLFGPIFELSTKGWKNLNFAWAAMFVVMSLLHFFFAFVFMHGKYWGEFTAFGDMIVMFSFIIIQFVVLRKFFKTPDA